MDAVGKDACQLFCQVRLRVEELNLGPSERHDSPLEKAAGDSISQDREETFNTDSKEKMRGEKRSEGGGGKQIWER